MKRFDETIVPKPPGSRPDARPLKGNSNTVGLLCRLARCNFRTNYEAESCHARQDLSRFWTIVRRFSEMQRVLRSSPPENSADCLPISTAGEFSPVPFSSANLAKSGRNCAKLREQFSIPQIVKTLWRRGRDSNPRYPFGYAGFQDRSHQPLGHLSAVSRSSLIVRRIALTDGIGNASSGRARE
jgi:hypothetical protein